MKYLEKLLNGAEVEWKALGEVAIYVRGLTYSKLDESSNNVGYKVLRANNITLSDNTVNLDDIKFVKYETKVKDIQKLCKSDILISAASGSREHVGKVAFINSDIDYYFGGFMGVVRCSSIINPRYLFHILASNLFQRHLDEMLNSSTINNISSKVITNFLIPIPPLEVQKEIVRILDTFTELTAELTARKKQYNYYRDKLLSFEEGEVEWKALGEIGEYSRKRISSSSIDKSNYVGVDNLLQNRAGKTDSNYAPTEGNLTGYSIGDVLIGNIRPYLKKIWLSDRVGGTNGDVLVIHINNSTILSPKYLYQVLAADSFFEYNMQHAKGAKMPRGNKAKIMEYLIPIPSLESQTRIVTILDKFDTLTTSISEGLPKEIELRKKQYEYYREKLLSFEKKEVEEP